MSNTFPLRSTLCVFVAAFAFTGATHAQTAAPAPTAVTADSAGATPLSEGEIRKIDKDNKKLTIKHGPLRNLDMPGMTMVFAVQDDAVLDQLQPGEKIRFDAEKIDGRLTVVKVEAAR